jgi:hypothetical protein
LVVEIATPLEGGRRYDWVGLETSPGASIWIGKCKSSSSEENSFAGFSHNINCRGED